MQINKRIIKNIERWIPLGIKTLLNYQTVHYQGLFIKVWDIFLWTKPSLKRKDFENQSFSNDYNLRIRRPF